MTSDTQAPRKRDCTTSTCMKWGNDGSLSPHDQNELMKHLCEKDPALAGSDAAESSIHTKTGIDLLLIKLGNTGKQEKLSK